MGRVMDDLATAAIAWIVQVDARLDQINVELMVLGAAVAVLFSLVIHLAVTLRGVRSIALTLAEGRMAELERRR